MEINLRSTRGPLMKINAWIKNRCKIPLTIRFDVFETLQSHISNIALYDNTDKFHLLLCLLHKNTCISTISCKIDSDTKTMEISSKTDSFYEGRKFNLLLRCVLVLLAPHILLSSTNERVETILSRAIHPVSILLMAKYFRATNPELESFIAANHLSYKTLTLENTQAFYEQHNELPEFETEEEFNAYIEENESFGAPILLRIHVHDPVIIEETKTLLAGLNIQCQSMESMEILGRGARTRKKRDKNKSKREKKKQQRKTKKRFT